MPEIGEDISIQNATFAWSTSEVAPSAAARSFRLCVQGSLSFRRGRINLVVGPTGSGKTSLLMAFLGTIWLCILTCIPEYCWQVKCTSLEKAPGRESPFRDHWE
jgi:DNA replication protein DnaC